MNVSATVNDNGVCVNQVQVNTREAVDSAHVRRLISWLLILLTLGLLFLENFTDGRLQLWTLHPQVPNLATMVAGAGLNLLTSDEHSNLCCNGLVLVVAAWGATLVLLILPLVTIHRGRLVPTSQLTLQMESMLTQS